MLLSIKYASLDYSGVVASPPCFLSLYIGLRPKFQNVTFLNDLDVFVR